MAAPKCRIDVWQPTIVNVNTSGAATTAQRPAAWVKLDTVTDVTTENPPGPNPNLRRANACTSVEIKDELFSPRIAYISIANRPQDFRAFDDETMETQHQDSDGNEIQISGSDVKTRIRRNWGPFSFFFREFQQIRIVDLETHMVLFTGRIYKISKKHDGQRGATVELVCKDALEELKNISMNTMPKEIHFAANTKRSTIVQAMLNLGVNYEASLPAGGSSKNQTSPVTAVLSDADFPINSNDNASSAAENSYKRFEESTTHPSQTTKLKARKTGSKHILQELSRWAILEPHEDETADNQFGYDFFVDPNIGSDNLLATTAPPPAMFNYFKRGNRLSAAGSAGQDASTYGLTCILPTVARATHVGSKQSNVGTTAASGNTSVDYFAVNTGHSLYPGQVITIGSEQMYVRFIANGNDEGGEEEVYVFRGWAGSTAASFSSSATITDNRPASAIMQKDTSSFDDTKEDMFTECALTYDTSYFIGATKMGTKEKTKHFEIMFGTEISGAFAWSGKDFDDDSAPSDADTPGTDSAEWVSAYREDGDTGSPTIIAPTVARIQYQSASSVTGSTNFGYVMLSNISTNFPKNNYTGDGGSTYEDYIVLKGTSSNATIRVNLNSFDVQTGRPSTAFAGGVGKRMRRVFSMTMESHDNLDDVRQEIAARLGQSVIAMKRGDFLVSKAPYYWADFKVRSVVADGSTGQTLTVKSDNGTAAINVTNYGFREGMLIHHRTADYSQIETVEVSGVDKDIYGYCYTMVDDTAFRVNLTESQSFAVDDKIRLYIPVRAGDAIFVDHILANVYGEHLVTAINFNEQPAPTTSYSTLGENEPRIRMRVGSVSRQNIWNSIAVDTLEANERHHPNLPKGNQTFSFSGTWSYPAANIVQWTAGDLRTSDGEVYQIAASNTSDATYGLDSAGMTGSNEYTVYLDPEGENPSGNIYHFYTVISTSYLEDDDNIVILKTSVGAIAEKANAVAGPNMDLSKTDTPKWEAFVFAHDESVTADLVKAATLTGDKLVNNTITVTQIGDDSISTAKIQANAITANEIVTNAVTANKIVAGAIIADKIDANAVTADKIQADSIAANKIQSNALDSHTITLTGGGKLITSAGAVRDGSNHYLSTGFTSPTTGLLIDRYGILGATGTGASNVEFYLSAADGKGYFGGGICTIGKTGIYFPPAADSGSSGAVEWEYNSKSTWLYRITGTNRLAFTSNVTTNTDAALTLIGMTLGNDSWRVPEGHFTTLYVGGTQITSGGGSSDGVVNSASWNTSTGVLTLGRSESLSSITVDLDGRYVTSDTNTWRGIDDTPVNGQTGESITSNWAYDHANNANAHHSSSGGGGGLSYWEESGTSFAPVSSQTAGYDIGTPSNGIDWLHFENAYGIKTNWANSATVIWETHGHHEFESDVYMKTKLTTEEELEVRAGTFTAGNMSLHFAGDTDTGFYRSSSDQISFMVGTYTGMIIDETSTNVSVGIAGVGNTSYELNVTGSARKTSSGGDWDSHSDDRIKTDVASISGGMATLAALNPVSYKYTDAWKEAVNHPQHTTQYGFLASEYKTVFPTYTTTGTNDLVKVDGKWELANIPDENDPKPNRLDRVNIDEKIEDIVSINTGAIVPHLVAAIKELEARISVLEGN